MGATRAQKEVYFNKLKELIAKYRACHNIFLSGGYQLNSPSFYLFGQCRQCRFEPDAPDPHCPSWEGYRLDG